MAGTMCVCMCAMCLTAAWPAADHAPLRTALDVTLPLLLECHGITTTAPALAAQLEAAAAHRRLLSATRLVAPVASISPFVTSLPIASVSSLSRAAWLPFLLNLLKKPPPSPSAFGGRFLAGKMKLRTRQMMLNTAPMPLQGLNGDDRHKRTQGQAATKQWTSVSQP